MKLERWFPTNNVVMFYQWPRAKDESAQPVLEKIWVAEKNEMGNAILYHYLLYF